MQIREDEVVKLIGAITMITDDHRDSDDDTDGDHNVYGKKRTVIMTTRNDISGCER